MKDLTVLQAKRYGIFKCNSGDSLLVAARTMVMEDVSGLVVVDDHGALIGIFTRTDLLKAGIHSDNWQKLPVEQFMTPQVVTVSPEDSISHVAQLLVEKQIHRVVIVEKVGGKRMPVGVISDADLVYHMTKEL
jgi:CBS domain-containing protein